MEELMSDRLENEVPQTTSDIVCVECETCPRLKSLDKNHGTCVGCDCDGVKYSMDMVPYEYSDDDLPDEWVIIEGRTAKQLAHEVDLTIGAGGYECPSCGDEFAMADRVSCPECGFIPEENRA